MLNQDEIKIILDAAVSHGGDYADLYLSESASGTVFAEDNTIRQFYRGFDMGAGIRVIKGDFASYYYTNDTSMSSLLRMAERVGESSGGDVILPFELSPLNISGKETLPVSLDIPGDMIRRINSEIRGISDKIIQVTLSYGDVNKNVLTASTASPCVLQRVTRKRFFVRVIAKEGDELQSAIETLGDTEPVFGWTEEQLLSKAKTAAERALMLLKAKDAPSGSMPVVMSSEAGGTMVHEACGHGLEGDSVSKGLSAYKERLGQKVASEHVTVIDDATLQGHYGSFAYDDEGNRGRRNVLIENGVLKSYMHDVRSARRMNAKTTGNARRESYHYMPQVRMSNTFIAPGDDCPGDIVSGIKKGFFVKKMGGGQVNTLNGDFVFEVSEGRLIENGKLSYPVRNASLIGNGPEALSSVFAVGNDLGFAIGTCGKGGQSVSVGDAQPTLGIEKLVIGGKG